MPLPVIDNVSQGILEKLGSRRIGDVDVRVQPSADAAKQFLDTNPLNIPVTQDDYDSITSRLTEEAKNFQAFEADAHVRFVVANDEQVSSGLLDFLFFFDLSTISWTGETEDEIHPFVETAVTGPIHKFFGRALRVSRNKALGTSSGRADYSISSDYFQLLRGEDKMRSRVKSENPMKELLEKSPKNVQWTTLYGPDVPYIFGYYSIGGTTDLLLQFVCVKSNASGLVPLTQNAFDLTKFSGMFGCRCFMLALLPHLLALREKISSPVGLAWQITRERLHGSVWRSSTVRIALDHEAGDCCLLKDLFYDKNASPSLSEQVERWKGIISGLPQSQHLMKLRRFGTRTDSPEDGTGLVRCLFAPLCQPESVTGKFSSDLTARLAILHVSKALETLHEARMVHNDVRWPNVVRKQGEDVYVLVDYDDMAEMDKRGMVPAVDGMDAQSHAPDISKEHNQKVDLWGLCKMMAETHCEDGNVSDVVKAGQTWLQAYPGSLTSSFYRDVANLCSSLS